MGRKKTQTFAKGTIHIDGIYAVYQRQRKRCHYAKTPGGT